MSRVLVQTSKVINPEALSKALASDGIVVREATATENYLGLGPAVVLYLADEPPKDFEELVRAKVQAEPEPTKSTFLTILSPDGTAWRVGVDDSGKLYVEGKGGEHV